MRVARHLVARSSSMDRHTPSLLTSTVPGPECDGPLLPHTLDALVPSVGPSPRERVASIVRTIEADIIPRLVRNHRVAPAAPLPAGSAAPLPTPLEVEAFVGYVLDDDLASFDGMINRLRERGMSIDNLYLGLLAPAARMLGEMWESDRVMFSDVTVAVGQLQRIMRGLSPAFGDEVSHPSDGRRILLMPAPGEQHTFGLTIVADFFRRAGWQVIGGVGDSSLDPVALVRVEWFDVLGISCGGQARLDWLKTGITAVRQASRNRAVGVMVGGPIFTDNPGLAAEVGADATAQDGRQAPGVAEQLLGSRVQRL
jgi:MerR family transcriptional regulator, light-induced transcriptional regulator